MLILTFRSDIFREYSINQSINQNVLLRNIRLISFSGQAAYNPNFEEIKGDWRERLKQRQAKARSGAADQKDT